MYLIWYFQPPSLSWEKGRYISKYGPIALEKGMFDLSLVDWCLRRSKTRIDDGVLAKQPP